VGEEGGTLSREPYICHHPPSFGHIYVAFLYKIKGLVRGKHRGGEGGKKGGRGRGLKEGGGQDGLLIYDFFSGGEYLLFVLKIRYSY